MGLGDKNDILSRFENGKQPKERDWNTLIGTSVNLTEDKDHIFIQPINLTSGSTTGNEFISQPVTDGDLNYTSSEAWDEIAPPFVPNLHPNLHVFTLDQTTFFAASGSGAQPSIGEIGSNKFIWEFNKVNGAILAGGPSGSFDSSGQSHVADAADDVQSMFFNSSSGCFTLVTGNSTGNQTGICTAVTPFTCVTGQPWWVKTRFRLEDNTKTKFFFGLTEEAGNEDSFYSGSAAAGKDRIGIVSRFDSSVTTGRILVTHNTLDSGLLTPDTLNITFFSAMINFGIYWDGIDSIRFYHSGGFASRQFIPNVSNTSNPHQLDTLPVNDQMRKKHTFNTANLLPSSSLRLGFWAETLEDDNQLIEFEYIQGAILTNRPG